MKWVSFIPSPSRRLVIRAAHHDAEPVYLSGEAGAGKSAIARWIHANSPRSTKPLILLTAKDSLVEKVNAADRGTIVIQDIHLFSEERQLELAKFIRSHSITEPLSGLRTLSRARVIATSDYPIGEFSKFDSVFKDFRIHLPSLNERRRELPDMIESLLNEMAHELKRDHVRSIERSALELLGAHEWRGNFRELRNILRYAILSTPGSKIEAVHLPDLNDPDGILLLGREGFLEVEKSLLASTEALRTRAL